MHNGLGAGAQSWKRRATHDGAEGRDRICGSCKPVNDFGLHLKAVGWSWVDLCIEEKFLFFRMLIQIHFS